MFRMQVKCASAVLAGAAIVFSGAASATNFAVLLGGNGQTQECSNIEWIEVDDLNIDVREMTTGLDVEYRLYGPGQAHWGQARFSSGRGGSKEVREWFESAAAGKDVRKQITINLREHQRDARRYNFYDCFPVAIQGGEVDPATGAVTNEVYTVQIDSGSIESAGDQPAERSNIKVEIGAAGYRSIAGFDSWQGGEPVTFQQAPFQTTKFRTNSPGHKTVGEITLRGAVTAGRKGLYEWINNSLNDGTRATVVLTELGPDGRPLKSGKTYTYYDCFPTRYVFPRMAVTNTTGNVMEEVALKPIRVELAGK